MRDRPRTAALSHAERHPSGQGRCRDDNGRPSKVYRRPARGSEDTLVYDEPDDGFFLSVGVSESRDYILIHAGHHASSETHLIAAAAKRGFWTGAKPMNNEWSRILQERLSFASTPPARSAIVILRT